MNRDICEHGNPEPCDECKSEALRLADALDNPPGAPLFMEAAAELRRLHAVNTELLEALKAVTTAQDLSTYGMALHNARAAIAKAEGHA